MHDQPIQLDASFDHMPHLSVSSWLHSIDSRVVSGEPIVIIDDGTTQRVVTAPCTGRIVDIYNEVGAHVFPRTVLGMIRPDLIMPEQTHGLGSIILGVLMIGLAVIAIPIISNVSPISMSSNPTGIAGTALPQTGQETTVNLPMPDAPAPGSSPNDDITGQDAILPEEQSVPNMPEGGSDLITDPNQLPEATPIDSNTDATDPNADNTDPNADSTDPNADSTDPNADSTDPNADSTDSNADSTDPNADSTDPNADSTDDTNDTTNNSAEQSASGYASNTEISEQFMFDVDRIITLTQEVEINIPSGVMSQREYDDIVSSAANEVTQMVDRLSQIIINNRDNPNINADNRRWFSSFTDAKDDCLAIYVTIRQSVQSQQPLPDLSSSFTGCYALADNFQ